MLTAPIDPILVANCRNSARRVVRQVEMLLGGQSTVGIERAIFRLLGVKSADQEGIPLANRVVDLMQAKGWLVDGAWPLAARLALTCGTFGEEQVLDLLAGRVKLAQADHTYVNRWAKDQAARILDKLKSVRSQRDRLIGEQPIPAKPWKYVIVATGDIRVDIEQACLAARQGADIIAVIRSTAQSLLDYVPDGLTHEGVGGTFATQANFALMRDALDQVSSELGRYIRLTNYASGLCMAEMAALGAIERLDMMLSDSMYGVLFRDINMLRTFIDQHAARTIQGWAGIIINTGEDNYLTTADAMEAGHTVLASQFLNEAFAQRTGIEPHLIGLGHAFEMNPAQEDGLLLSMADALLSRACFPDAPLKYMPPTRHMDGDIFQGQVLDAMFNLTSVATGQTIHLVGMATEAVHSPHVQDRFTALKNFDYVSRYSRSFGAEFSARPDGIIAARCATVLAEAEAMLAAIAEDGLFASIARGAFGNVRRAPDGGRGLDGVFAVGPNYLDPLGLLPGGVRPC